MLSQIKRDEHWNVLLYNTKQKRFKMTAGHGIPEFLFSFKINDAGVESCG